MNPSRSVLAMAAVTAALAFAAGSVRGQVARSGAGANSQLQMQVQQLAAEKTRMEADNAKLKKDLEDVRKELDSLKGVQKSNDQRAKQSSAALAQSDTQRESAEEQLRQTKTRMEQLIAKFRETAQSLRDVEADRAAAKQSLAARDQQLKTCADRNLSLYQLNDEVLTRFESQGFWAHVAAAEPFTRLKRIQNENLVDGYKVRADEQRVIDNAATP